MLEFILGSESPYHPSLWSKTNNKLGDTELKK